MTPEVEIKFACETATLEALAARVFTAPARDQRLVAVYYDTPDGRLAANRASLRLRTDETGRTVQTFKTGEGLGRREAEHETAPGRLALTGEDIRATLSPEGLAQLAPRFTVQVRRRTCVIEAGDSRIELALDQGEIQAAGARSPVCEAELELLSGNPRDLFTLALALTAELPLTLSLRSKSDRGNRLAAAGAPVPHASLQAGLSCEEALRQALVVALGEAAARVLQTAGDPSVEAVHQLRVALRRLRSLLSVFRRRWAPGDPAVLRTGLRDLSRACGEIRELDVLLGRADPAGALAPVLIAARRRTAEALGETLSGVRARTTLLEGLIFAEAGDWRTRPGAGSGAASGLSGDLRRRWRRIRRLGDAFSDLGPEERHDLRLRIKALRYALDVLDLPEWRPLAEALSPRLRAAQEALGALNDADAAKGHLERLGLSGDVRREASRLVAELKRRDDRTRARKAVRRLVESTPALFT
jgi:inorganic triphosphatase YgiF